VNLSHPSLLRGLAKRVSGVVGLLSILMTSASSQVTGGGAQIFSLGPGFRNYGNFFEEVVSTAPIKTVVAASGFLAVRSDGTYVGLQVGTDPTNQFYYSEYSGDPIRVAAGGQHFLAYTRSGLLLQWEGPARPLPKITKQVICLTTGRFQDGAIFSDGSLLVWGDDGPPKLNIPSDLGPIKQLAFGIGHAIALKRDGAIATWGNGAQILPKNLLEVVQVGAEIHYSVALQGNGKLVAWGTGAPTIPATLEHVVQFALRPNEAMGVALRDDGSVVSFGQDSHGGTLPVPENLPPLVSVTYSSAGVGGVTEDGHVITWNNEGGTLQTILAPSNLKPLKRIAGGIICGFAAGIQFDGSVRCWGDNSLGQCNVPDGLIAKDIDCGRNFAVALRQDGTVACWGANDVGQCNVPVGLSNVVGISAGRDHSLAVRADGTVVGWGNPAFGKTQSPSGLASVAEVAAGDDHSVARRKDGTVVCWGNGSRGCCTPPATLGPCKAISAGNALTLAILKDGTPVHWGRDLPTIHSGSKFNALIAKGSIVALNQEVDRSLVLLNYSIMFPYRDQAAVITTAGIISQFVLTTKNSFVLGGTTATGVISLANPLGPGGETVGLWCDNPAVTVPRFLFVPENATSVTFPIVTTAVTKPITCHVSMEPEWMGGAPKVLAVTVTPAAKLGEVVLNRTFVGGGAITPVLGNVVLTAPTINGQTVTLKSSSPNFTVPEVVKVTAGFDTVRFVAHHKSISTKETVTITAKVGGVVQTTQIELRPLVVVTLTPKVTSMATPMSTNATVVISSITDFDRVVTLSTTNSTLLTIPATVVVPAGASEVTFKVKGTKTVTSATNVNITATYNGNSKTVKMTLVPR